MARLDDGWCAALDRETLMCKTYDNRPSVCREFKMGGDECIEFRDRIPGTQYLNQELCEGDKPSLLTNEGSYNAAYSASSGWIVVKIVPR